MIQSKSIYNFNNHIILDYNNSRLKIIDTNHTSKNDWLGIIELAHELNFGKIICFCRDKYIEDLQQYGFILEGQIAGFFDGNDAFCLSLFIDKKRQYSKYNLLEDEILTKCQTNLSVKDIDDDIIIRDAKNSDINQMILLFKKVFKTYPSPIFDANYLNEILGKKVLFKIAVKQKEIICIASADIDVVYNNAEITDCCTNPIFRGKGLLTNIIIELEKSLNNSNIGTLYSLSRATEPGINMVLSKMQYKYSGRMLNNCNISGDFEDMNIWVKN